MNRGTKRFTYVWAIIIVLVATVTFIDLPYYVTTPGEARVLDEVINVEGGSQDGGEFMLTTVRVGEANLVQYIWAQFNEYHELIAEDLIKREGESDDEYHQRQLDVMANSQTSATIVAYEAAKKEIKITKNGVLVTGIIEGMPADGKLELGDLIVEVEGKRIEETEQLLDELGSYEESDTVNMTIKRGDQEKQIELGFSKFPKAYGTEDDKVGVGITGPVTATSIETDPSININTDEIGGPSAGLMFTLEIYNQLTKEDWTKGYDIAGTGTINESGEVGPIGGIKQKIVAADGSGAEIFFAPVAHSNYDDAMEAAEDIDTDMKIVPVETFQDAIDYLKQLDVK
ncbi:PDZ domain-containing protein [Alkalihalobacillus hwajinpoensis]|uniref:SepM family pheromone-processing serine protease n=1 Tax=Guptibacillus hwajinpoensis TaxID=208199 RepID=UPI0018836D26|nr:SepM family pheromone-processing serine protease [Pseudalkalibacillus hwajinpoensis]MBF0708333.1 PDZ domain-containing protein [Pseudalkalibacillus hwajinpoensis]